VVDAEARGQRVDQKAPDELVCRQCHGLVAGARRTASWRKPPLRQEKLRRGECPRIVAQLKRHRVRRFELRQRCDSDKVEDLESEVARNVCRAEIAGRT